MAPAQTRPYMLTAYCEHAVRPPLRSSGAAVAGRAIQRALSLLAKTPQLGALARTQPRTNGGSAGRPHQVWRFSQANHCAR